MAQELKNKSVKNVARIARKYGYKMEIIKCGPAFMKRAFLSISNNFLKSPYPNHITSAVRSLDYVEKIFNNN